MVYFIAKNSFAVEVIFKKLANFLTNSIAFSAYKQNSLAQLLKN